MTYAAGKPVRKILVLSGGGGRGAYEVGACQVLVDKKWHPDMILGNSIGAMNGAILVAPQIARPSFPTAVQELDRVWREEMRNDSLYEVSTGWHPMIAKTIYWVISLLQALEKTTPGAGQAQETNDLIDAILATIPDEAMQDRAGKPAIEWFLRKIRCQLKEGMAKPSLIEREGWRKMVRESIDVGQLNQESAPYLGITATDVETGMLRWFWNQPPPDSVQDRPTATALSVQHVLASSCIWCLYPSLEITERHYWDGALLANTPVQPAIDVLLADDSGQTEIVVVLMTPFCREPEKPCVPIEETPTVLDGLARFLDWMMLGTFRGQLARLDPSQRARVHIVAPETLQGVIQMIDYAPDEIEELIQRGKEDALKDLVHLGKG